MTAQKLHNTAPSQALLFALSRHIFTHTISFYCRILQKYSISILALSRKSLRLGSTGRAEQLVQTPADKGGRTVIIDLGSASISETEQRAWLKSR